MNLILEGKYLKTLPQPEMEESQVLVEIAFYEISQTFCRSLLIKPKCPGNGSVSGHCSDAGSDLFERIGKGT